MCLKYIHFKHGKSYNVVMSKLIYSKLKMQIPKAKNDLPQIIITSGGLMIRNTIIIKIHILIR